MRLLSSVLLVFEYLYMHAYDRQLMMSLIACVQGMYTLFGVCLLLVLCKYKAARCDIGVRCEKYEGCQG